MIRHALTIVTLFILIGIATQALYAYPGDTSVLMQR